MFAEDLVKLAERVCKKKTEMQNLELKAANKGCPTKLYDTLSSFSNQDCGGIILFGIDESKGFEITGVYDLHDLQKKVTEQCNQMKPPVRAVFTCAEVEGKDICSAEIPAIDLSDRPCYYKGVGRIKGSYIRVGDADQPMTDCELYSFEAFRKHLYSEERKIEKAKFEMIDRQLLDEYLIACKKERAGFSRLNEEQTLEMLHITDEGKLTLAGIMNFAIYPQGYFPQLAITCVVVPGTEIGVVAADNARFIDNKRIEGTIAEMATEAVNFCNRNMKHRTIVDPETARRADKSEYPINAVREAIFNALIHRDYSMYTETIPIQVIIFTDRLEVHSPGGLYGRMTIDQLGYAKLELRNPAIANMAEKMTQSENRGSGIPMMRRECREYNLPEPVFENKRNEFVVTFYNSMHGSEKGAYADRNSNYAIKEDKVNYALNLLEFCETPRTRKEIADFLGIETVFYAMDKHVKPLLETGELLMTIPDKPKSYKQKYYAKL